MKLFGILALAAFALLLGRVAHAQTSAPVVTNLPASSIQGTAATLAGQVLSTGGASPAVTIYYGPVDGGTNAAAWAFSDTLGPEPGSFVAWVNSLSTNTTCYFTAFATNTAGGSWAAPSQSFTTLAADPANGPPMVLTAHYDNTRQCANTNETILTPANVNVQNFGKLFSYPVDGYVYTQPLYIPNLAIPGLGAHNVIYVATEQDSVYAFDADSNVGANGGLLWHVNLGTCALSASGDFGTRYKNSYTDIVPDVGITGTPVIDPVSGTLYVDAFTHEGSGYVHRIHALNLTNGMEQPYSPVVVAASVPGVGVASVNGVVSFNAQQQLQRPGLTLAGGRLYVGYGPYADTDPYHGWVIGFNAANLQPLTNYVFNTTPNATKAVFGAYAGQGGVWMGGDGLCVDAATNIYFEVGNGSFDANKSGGDYGDSFIKLSTTNGLAVADYFTPHDQATMAANDQDLGSGGSVLLPDSVGSAAHPHLIVGAGKEGTIYLVDRDNLGHYNSANDSQIVQQLNSIIGGVWCSPAYFNHLIYYHGSGDVLKAFGITNGVMTTSPVSKSSESFGVNGTTPTPVVSANGISNAIVWEIDTDAATSSGAAILHAYNATNLSQELYNTGQDSTRDNPGGAVKHTPPTIVNGKVYVAAEYALSVYGNGTMLATPVMVPNGGGFTNSVTVTLSDATAGADVYYTLDGTVPTTNSTRYTASFVLTNTTLVQILAAKAGAINSGIVSAGFIDLSGPGNGTGLVGAYWTNVTSAQFTNTTFTNLPALIRSDSTINFNWGTGTPATGMRSTNYAVRWTGMIQPRYTETYNLSATMDDAVRLWVNGKLLINGWVTEPATTWNVSIPLQAQQYYNLQIDYCHGTGTSEAQLAWSSPSTPGAVVPETQLYPATNPPPAVQLLAPTNGSTFLAGAGLTVSANAADQYNGIAQVRFYNGTTLLTTASNAPYTLTLTGLAAGAYSLAAVATDTTGLASTSAPVSVTLTVGSSQPYGLTSRPPIAPFLNMPTSITGALPLTLSQTGVFTNTSNLGLAAGLIPYAPNTPFWSDGAIKDRWLALPNNGAPYAPDEQISFAPTGSWTFPAGTVFVKHFSLVTDQSNPSAPVRRLETRLLVRDNNGAVYGVTYKWRPDNSDADLLTNSLSEDIVMTNADSTTWTQTWYYPSPSDCLQCHTPAANYVLGLKTSQLNGTFTYPTTGQTDNQLRALNHLGMFYPAIDETGMSNYTALVSITNQNAAVVDRVRSYLDANCSQCHQPGGTGPTFDARWDTPLTNQDIIYGILSEGDLGYDNDFVVTPDDTWRSVLYLRADMVNPQLQMPPLARNLVDTNAMSVIAAWINSLPGTPALPPPVINPAGGTFTGSVQVSLSPSDTNAILYYTLDGSLPTTNSLVYETPFTLTTNAIVSASAFEPGFTNSVATSTLFIVNPNVVFTAPPAFNNGVFQMQLTGTPGATYLLEASTDLVNWVPVVTNVPSSTPFLVTDPDAANFPWRFYRVVQLPAASGP